MLKDVIEVAGKNNITAHQAHRVLRRAYKCPDCGKVGMINYTCSDGESSTCLFCDSTYG